MGTIVVGVDGSSSAERAVVWAAHQARRTGDAVEVVHVFHADDWTTPVFAASERTVPGWLAAEVRGDVLVEELSVARQHQLAGAAASGAAERRLDDMLTPLHAQLEGVTVARVTVDSHHPAAVLVDRSREAELLVVGRRGRSDYDGFGLGSVSEFCASRAHCPVVVVGGKD